MGRSSHAAVSGSPAATFRRHGSQQIDQSDGAKSRRPVEPRSLCGHRPLPAGPKQTRPHGRRDSVQKCRSVAVEQWHRAGRC